MMLPWHKPVSDPRRSLLDDVCSAIDHVSGGGAAAPAPIRPESFLGADLGLSSIAVARLAALLQKGGGRRPLPLHTLFVRPDGTILQDVRVSDIVSFLERERHTSRA